MLITIARRAVGWLERNATPENIDADPVLQRPNFARCGLAQAISDPSLNYGITGFDRVCPQRRIPTPWFSGSGPRGGLAVAVRNDRMECLVDVDSSPPCSVRLLDDIG